MDANGRSCTRRNPAPMITNAPKQPEARSRPACTRTTAPSGPPTRRITSPNGRGPWKILGRSDDLQPGCIGLRMQAGDIHRDCIIDPAHDSIGVNYIWWQQVDGQRTKDRHRPER
jgi:hypothetical protein